VEAMATGQYFIGIQLFLDRIFMFLLLIFAGSADRVRTSIYRSTENGRCTQNVRRESI
jgi:hypothetical protein